MFKGQCAVQKNLEQIVSNLLLGNGKTNIDPQHSPVSNAQGSRLIIVVVQLGALKILCSSSMETLKKKKERQDETQFTTKIDGFSFPR